MRIRGVLFFCAVTFVGATNGLDIPRIGDLEGVAPPSKSATDPAKTMRLGSLEIVLEETELGLVESKVGHGKLEHGGDASTSESWLCYTDSTANPPQRIWLSSGEMASGIYIDSVSVMALEVVPEKNSDCPELPSALKPITFQNGLSLNTSVEDIKKKFGTPTIWKGLWVYSHAHNEGEWSVNGDLFIKIEMNRVRHIQISHVTSN